MPACQVDVHRRRTRHRPSTTTRSIRQRRSVEAWRDYYSYAFQADLMRCLAGGRQRGRSENAAPSSSRSGTSHGFDACVQVPTRSLKRGPGQEEGGADTRSRMLHAATSTQALGGASNSQKRRRGRANARPCATAPEDPGHTFDFERDKIYPFLPSVMQRCGPARARQTSCALARLASCSQLDACAIAGIFKKRPAPSATSSQAPPCASGCRSASKVQRS